MPIIEYTFLQHFYISPKETYEKILCECINKGQGLKEKCGGNFVAVSDQSHGECDAVVPSTDYGLDFKLMISETLAEFLSITRPQLKEIAKGVTVTCCCDPITANVVLLPNACRNLTEERLNKYRKGHDKLSKAVVHFFDETLNTAKNILLFLPLYVTTVDKTKRTNERFAAIDAEFSDTLQYIHTYRNTKHPGLDTYFVYIVNVEKTRKSSFVISQFTTEGLRTLDVINMYSLNSVVELAEKYILRPQITINVE